MKEMTYSCPDGVIRTWQQWVEHLFSDDPRYGGLAHDQSILDPIVPKPGNGPESEALSR